MGPKTIRVKQGSAGRYFTPVRNLAENCPVLSPPPPPPHRIHSSTCARHVWWLPLSLLLPLPGGSRILFWSPKASMETLTFMLHWMTPQVRRHHNNALVLTFITAPDTPCLAFRASKECQAERTTLNQASWVEDLK